MDEVTVVAGILIFLVVLFLSFPIYVLARLAHLRRDVNMLMRRAELGPSSLAPSRPKAPAAMREEPSTAAPVTPIRIVPVQPATPPPQARPLQPIVAQAVPERAAPPPIVTPAPPARKAVKPAPAPTRPSPAPRRDIESLLGANWLAKLGIAAIAVATAFFLQYAFRSGWIGPRGQVAIGLSAAAIMLGAGQYLLTKERYRSYAQVVASGGIILYFLSIYAAYSFYHPGLLPFGPAFAALAAGALAASVLAVKNDTEVVALLCIVGAFATPIMIRQGGPPTSSSLLQLYAYLSVLNLWVVALTRVRPWHSLCVVAFAGTWLLFFGAGTLKATGWETEGFAGLFLLASCYMGARALYSRREEAGTALEARLADTAKAGLGLIVGGCIAFAIASAIILAGMGLLGLSDVALAGLLLALLLAGLAVALPPLGRYDHPIRLLFGYLTAGALAAMMVTAVTTSAPMPRAHVSIAFSFAVFNFLIFLAASLVMNRRPEEEAPAAVLAGANALIHVLMVFHILRGVEILRVPAAPLWFPLAGLLAMGGLWLSLRQRPTARVMPGALIVTALVLPLSGLLGALPEAGSAAVRWPTWSLAMFGAEFLLVSASWLAQRNRIAWQASRPEIVAAFANLAIFFGLMARAVGMDRVQGLSLLAGCAVALAVYHGLVGAIALRRDDPLHRLIYLGLALTLITIAIPLQLRASYITIAWAAEAAVLVWTGMAAKEPRARTFGVVLLVLAACRALSFDLPQQPDHFLLLFNLRTLSGASVIVAAYLAAWWLWKGKENLSTQVHRVPWDLTLAANLFTLLFVSVDLWDFVGREWAAAARPSIRQFALTAFWTVYAAAAMGFAIAYRFRPLRLFAIMLLGCAAAKSLAVDLLTRPDHVQLLLNPRMMAGAFVIAAAYLLAWQLWHRVSPLPAQEQVLPAALSVAANILTLLFVSVDLWDYAGVRWPSVRTASAQQLALSLFWTCYALAGISVGIWKRLRPVRLFAMGLLYLSIAKVFLYDLRNLETLYRIASFFTLGVILLLVSLLYTRFEERLHADEQTENHDPPRHLGMAA